MFRANTDSYYYLSIKKKTFQQLLTIININTVTSSNLISMSLVADLSYTSDTMIWTCLEQTASGLLTCCTRQYPVSKSY